ncbi:MAG: hypothetical protein VB106_06815 [Clostridiaceae bacterium]|nr:hypothetical protein [Clostridiaceae bacterium]
MSLAADNEFAKIFGNSQNALVQIGKHMVHQGGINAASFIPYDYSGIEINNVEFTSSSNHKVGLAVTNQTSVTGMIIKDCKFNNLDYGIYDDASASGSYRKRAQMEIDSCIFKDINEHALYAETLKDSIIKNCNFEDVYRGVQLYYGNHGYYEADGNSVANIGNVTIENSIFNNVGRNASQAWAPTLYYNGGAIVVQAEKISVVGIKLINCTITNNERGVSLSAYGSYSLEAKIINCDIYDNIKQNGDAPDNASPYGNLIISGNIMVSDM